MVKNRARHMISTPDVSEVWEWLDAIPDPEIPIVSLVDLGIVREVAWDSDTLVVAVTPTYSACPATAVINFEIEAALKAKGISKLRLERRLSPPWTTDWLSDAGRLKLREYGIAPPVAGTSAVDRLALHARRLAGGSRLQVACPACGSEQTECLTAFGSTLCKASYRCRDCLEPFDYFKCI